MQFLSRAGLVQENGPHQWIVPGNLDWTLKQMAVAADRQRMLAQSGVAISGDKMPHCRTSLDETGTLQGRVLANVEEEQTGQMHLILEGTDGVVHFIPITAPSATAAPKATSSPTTSLSLRQHTRGAASKI